MILQQQDALLEMSKSLGKKTSKDTLAALALEQIAQIYHIDNQLADLLPEERLAFD